MKRLFTRILVCAAVAALLLSGLAVNAAPLVSEVELNSTGDIVSVPTSNLFQNFKGLMPSMEVSQLIKITNNYSKTVKIYLKVEAADTMEPTAAAQLEGLLDELHLKLTLKKPNSQTTDVIFNEKASGTTDGKRILLGTYAKHSSGSITATVSVPSTLDNKYMNTEGEIVWIFSCEEVVSNDDDDDDDDDEDSSFITTATNVRMPETGGFPMLALLPMGAVLVVGGLLLGRKKR